MAVNSKALYTHFNSHIINLCIVQASIYNLQVKGNKKHEFYGNRYYILSANRSIFLSPSLINALG